MPSTTASTASMAIGRSAASSVLASSPASGPLSQAYRRSLAAFKGAASTKLPATASEITTSHSSDNQPAVAAMAATMRPNSE